MKFGILYFRRLLFVLLLLPVAVSMPLFAQQSIIAPQDVNLKPEKPGIGDKLIIYFRSADKSTVPVLVFSYSNFYEMPNQLSLEPDGEQWKTSFVVPRYAKYASFYIKQGDKIYQPEAKRHYELIFYQNGKPVLDTYLYKSYSLSAQMGKSDSLRVLTYRMLDKELALYPSNYAAKLRLLANKMADEKANSSKYLQEGLSLVEAKFREDPAHVANINLVTMGYIILGQNYLMDSLKARVLRQYPQTEIGFEYRTEQAYKTADVNERIKKLENLLKEKGERDKSSIVDIHQRLFVYYAGQKDVEKALLHARGVAAVKNPWWPKSMKEIASVLVTNSLALDTARKYAEMALNQVTDYPFGVIRYFPEYSYIPGYVADRPKLVSAQRGDILSLIGHIYVLQKNYPEAEKVLLEAQKLSQSPELLHNLAYLYEQTARMGAAMDIYRQILVKSPVDTTAMEKYKRSYLAVKGSDKGLKDALDAIHAGWEAAQLPVLRAGQLNEAAPEFRDVYDMNGKPVNPEMLAGKVVVLDFWATWCVPCIEGFPYMQKAYEQYKDRKDIVFLIMNSGSKNSLQDAVNWVKQQKFTLPFYYNDRKLAESFKVNTIPSTFIIDRKGIIRYKTVGFEGPMMEPKLNLEIKDILNGNL